MGANYCDAAAVVVADCDELDDDERVVGDVDCCLLHLKTVFD